MDYNDYKEEQLIYFKDLIEGKATVSWRGWWNTNDETMKSQLKRPEYARLKFGHLKYAFKILEAKGIDVEWGTAAEKESYYATLHKSVLDENGRPNEEFRRKSYNGACGDFIDGNLESCENKLKKIITKLKKIGGLKAQEDLEGMQFDGEMMVNSKTDEGFGKALLEAVVSFGYGDDLTDFAVNKAEEILNNIKKPS